MQKIHENVRQRLFAFEIQNSFRFDEIFNLKAHQGSKQMYFDDVDVGTFMEISEIKLILPSRHERKREKRRDRRDWEVETPRSKRSNADNDDFVTPYMKSKDTPSQMPWDDEDHTTPGKLSSWDLPTPESSRRHSDESDWNSSRRSSSSRSRRNYEKVTSNFQLF